MLSKKVSRKRHCPQNRDQEKNWQINKNRPLKKEQAEEEKKLGA